MLFPSSWCFPGVIGITSTKPTAWYVTHFVAYFSGCAALGHIYFLLDLILDLHHEQPKTIFLKIHLTTMSRWLVSSGRESERQQHWFWVDTSSHLEGWDVIYNIIFCYIANILLHNRNLFGYIINLYSLQFDVT